MLPIFQGLTKDMEAQSFMRYIFKTIVSRVNLIELEKFIKEKVVIEIDASKVSQKTKSDGKLQEEKKNDEFSNLEVKKTISPQK